MIRICVAILCLINLPLLFLISQWFDTVVALLICGACLLPGKQSAGWLFCGMGCRMLEDLGCYLDVAASQREPASRLHWFRDQTKGLLGSIRLWQISISVSRSTTIPEIRETKNWKSENRTLICNRNHRTEMSLSTMAGHDMLSVHFSVSFSFVQFPRRLLTPSILSIAPVIHSRRCSRG